VAKALGLSATIYGAAMIVGAAGGSSDPLRPLGFLAGRVATETVALPTTPPADFDRAFAAQASGGKPVLVMFTADWCTVCKSNEKVLASPELTARLAHTARLSVDISDQTTATEAVMVRFGIVGPPVLFLLKPDGEEVPGSRIIGVLNAADLVARLTAAGA